MGGVEIGTGPGERDLAAILQRGVGGEILPQIGIALGGTDRDDATLGVIHPADRDIVIPDSGDGQRSRVVDAAAGAEIRV